MPTRRQRRLETVVGFVLVLGCVTSSLARDDDPPSSTGEEPYRVRAVRYLGRSHPRITDERLDWERVLLSRTDRGWVAPRPDLPTDWLELGRIAGADGRGSLLFPSALREIPTAIARAYARSGIGAVRVTIRDSDLEALSRTGSDGVLSIHIVEGVVGVVSVQALVGEDTLDVQQTLEEPAVDRIRRDSPIGAGDSVELDTLQDYASAWNRFRHRRVELGLRPGRDDGEVQLDYWVSAVRPWSGALEVENTGTRETGRWRERASWSHESLTGRDDRLGFGFVTAEFDESNAGFLSYQLPIRPVPLLAVRAYGVHSEYDASEVGAFDLDYSGEDSRAGLELRSNVYGRDGLFTDVVVAGEYHRIETENATIASSAEASFAIASFGLELEQGEGDTAVRLGLHSDWSLATLGGSDEQDVENLGRTDADDDWRRVRLDCSGRRPATAIFAQPTESRAPSPVVFSYRLRGQDSLGSRTPANFTLLAGGLHTVRGYPEAFAAGDRGVIATAEVGLHLTRLLAPGPPSEWRGRRVRLRPESERRAADWDFVPRLFVDAARIEQNDRLSFERNVSLWSSGIGCDVLIRRRARLRVDWGVALDDANNGTDEVDAGESRWHVSFVLAF